MTDVLGDMYPSAAPAVTTPAPSPVPLGTPAEGGPQQRDLLSGGSSPAPQGQLAKGGAVAVADYKLPAGLEASNPIVGAFAQVAADHGLAPAVAQNLIDAVGPSIAQTLAAQDQAWPKLQREWQASALADPVIGGARLEREVVPAIKALIDNHLGEAFSQALELTGAGNHPGMIRGLWRIANLVLEAKPTIAPPSAARTVAEKLYDSRNVNGVPRQATF